MFCQAQPQPNPYWGLSLVLVLINPATHPAVFMLKVKYIVCNADNWTKHVNTKVLLTAKSSISIISIVLMIVIVP